MEEGDYLRKAIGSETLWLTSILNIRPSGFGALLIKVTSVIGLKYNLDNRSRIQGIPFNIIILSTWENCLLTTKNIHIQGVSE